MWDDETAASIPFKPAVVEQFHRDLYQYTSVPAGQWKTVENSISERLPDGTLRERFRTVSAAQTPAAMEELHERFLAAREAGEHHPLLLVACYVFDFLAIHPFRDGNGRIGRLLTLLLLYQSGYEVGRYISLERLVSDSRASYYDALQAAGHGWHEGEHSIWPWLEYLLGILTAAYREFEERANLLAEGRGAKTAAIEQFVRMSGRSIWRSLPDRLSCCCRQSSTPPEPARWSSGASGVGAGATPWRRKEKRAGAALTMLRFARSRSGLQLGLSRPQMPSSDRTECTAARDRSRRQGHAQAATLVSRAR